MTNEELTLYNIGENLDSLMTLIRGGKWCVPYSGTGRLGTGAPGEPLSVHAAKGLVAYIHRMIWYIITGFVLLPPATKDGLRARCLLAMLALPD